MAQIVIHAGHLPLIMASFHIAATLLVLAALVMTCVVALTCVVSSTSVCTAAASPDIPVSSIIDSQLQDNGVVSRSLVLDESYNGKTFHAFKGEVLHVQLKETDPAQAWQFKGSGSFRVVDDHVMEMYPAIHDFRVKIRGPGDLRFDKIDGRSGDLPESFKVHIVIDETPVMSGHKAHPLSD